MGPTNSRRTPTNFRPIPDELRRTSAQVPDELRRTFGDPRRTPTNFLCKCCQNRDSRRTPDELATNSDELVPKSDELLPQRCPTNSDELWPKRRRTPDELRRTFCVSVVQTECPDELPTNSDELPAIRRRTPTNFCPSSRRTPTNFRATQLTSLLFLCLFLTFSNFCMVFVFWLDFLSDLAKILDFRWFCV